MSSHARLMKSAMWKLEAVPKGARYPWAVLTPDEYDAAVETLRAAIRFVRMRECTPNRGRCKPRSFRYLGTRYHLAYSGSTAGRLFIVGRGGRNVIASDYDVI